MTDFLQTLLRSMRSQLGRTLAIRIVFFSAAIMTVITAVQLSWEYRELKGDLQSTLGSVSVHVDSLSRSVWTFDEKQIDLTLGVLRNLPYVVHVEVRATGGAQIRSWAQGRQIRPEDASVQMFPLHATVLGQETRIGDFTVTADLSELRSRIFDRAVAIIVTNAVKTLLVSTFMLYLFHQAIGLRLARLLPGSGVRVDAEQASRVLLSVQASGARGDELDQIAALLKAVYQKYEAQNAELGGALDLQKAIFDSVPESIVMIRRDGTLLSVNQAALRLSGYAEDELLGQNVRLLMSEPDVDRHTEQTSAEGQTGLGAVIGKGRQVNVRSKSGEMIPVFLSVTELQHGDALRYIGVMRDLRDEQKSEQLVHRLAYYDALTGCPNRVLLRERIAHAIEKSSRSHRFGAILFVDLDHFKRVNDLWGHGAGDELLQHTAKRIKSNLRVEDTLARFGGDEFVLLLEEVGEMKALAARYASQVAGKLLALLAEPFVLQDGMVNVSASIGISLIDWQAGGLPEDLIREADMAMFKAKSEGRNSYAIYEIALQEAIRDRNTIEQDLQQALSRDQLRLHFQPQFDRSGRLTGCEALIRWKHPDRGWIPPAEFIPIAEQSRLIVDLGSWVLDQACASLARWRDHPRLSGITLSINVSVRQCHDPDFLQKVLKSARRNNIAHGKLIVEITESIFLDQTAGLLERLKSLKEAGVSLSLDDFGTGYSSLSYLGRLPLDELKIDRAFVHGIETDPSNRVLVQSIVGLAQNLGLQVIAEGVESESQYRILSELGCYRYQGYWFSRPLPPEELEQKEWIPVSLP